MFQLVTTGTEASGTDFTGGHFGVGSTGSAIRRDHIRETRISSNIWFSNFTRSPVFAVVHFEIQTTFRQCFQGHRLQATVENTLTLVICFDI